MGCVNVTNISILANPAHFLSPLQFDISFECIADLQEDLEWKVVYVGSAESEAHDQVLDSTLLGPVRMGMSNFVFQADPPDPSRIPKDDLLGVTAILLIGLYKSKDFIRVGYFVNNEYDSEELKLNPPADVDVNRVMRNILADKPRVTRFPIAWDEPIVSNNNFNNFNNENTETFGTGGVDVTKTVHLSEGSNSGMNEEMMPMEVMSTQ